MRLDRLIILLVLAALGSCKVTQTTQSVPQRSSYSEDLSVHRPVLKAESNAVVAELNETVIPSGHLKAELDTISAMIVSQNAKSRREQGFTIQLYSGSDRTEAAKMLGRIRIEFPEIKADMTYYQPDFKVRAGQFLDRIVAYETFQEIRTVFPDALLVPDKIKVNYD